MRHAQDQGQALVLSLSLSRAPSPLLRAVTQRQVDSPVPAPFSAPAVTPAVSGSATPWAMAARLLCQSGFPGRDAAGVGMPCPLPGVFSQDYTLSLGVSSQAQLPGHRSPLAPSRHLPNSTCGSKGLLPFPLALQGPCIFYSHRHGMLFPPSPPLASAPPLQALSSSLEEHSPLLPSKASHSTSPQFQIAPGHQQPMMSD